MCLPRKKLLNFRKWLNQQLRAWYLYRCIRKVKTKLFSLRAFFHSRFLRSKAKKKLNGEPTNDIFLPPGFCWLKLKENQQKVEQLPVAFLLPPFLFWNNMKTQLLHTLEFSLSLLRKKTQANNTGVLVSKHYLWKQKQTCFQVSFSNQCEFRTCIPPTISLRFWHIKTAAHL